MTKQEKKEYEANIFAVCLLMPEHLLKREIKKLGGLDLSDDKQAKELCKTFGVSMNALAFRLSLMKDKLK